METIRKQYPARLVAKIEGRDVKKSHITKIELADGVGDELDELIVTLRNPGMVYTKGQQKLKGCSITCEGGRIGKRWDTLFTGRIGKVDRKGDTNEMHTLTLRALPIDISDGWHQARFILHRDHQRFSDIIREVCSSFHPDIKTNGIQDSPIIGKIYAMQQNETDIQFCQRMALECGGWEFAIKGNTVIFRASTPTDVPVYVFEWGKTLSFYEQAESDDKKIASASVKVPGDQNSVETEDEDVDVATRRTDEDATADEVDRGPYAMGKTPIQSIYRPWGDGVAGQAEAKGITKEPAVAEVKMTLSGPGDIRVRGGKCVLVKGLGDLDGKYYVREVNFISSGEEPLSMTTEVSNKQAEPDDGSNEEYDSEDFE